MKTMGRSDTSELRIISPASASINGMASNSAVLAMSSGLARNTLVMELMVGWGEGMDATGTVPENRNGSCIWPARFPEKTTGTSTMWAAIGDYTKRYYANRYNATWQEDNDAIQRTKEVARYL